MDDFYQEKVYEAVEALQDGGASLEEILEAMATISEEIEEAIQLKQAYSRY